MDDLKNVDKVIKKCMHAYEISWCTLAHVWSNTLSIARTIMHVIAVILRTVTSKPPKVTEASSADTVAIVKTAIWTADDWKMGQ